MASILHCFIEIVELVAWRLLPIITIPGISYRKCHFGKWFGTGPHLYWWITWRGESIYMIINLIWITKIVLLPNIWAKSSDLNMFFQSFLHIFCVIKITVQSSFRFLKIGKFMWFWCDWLQSYFLLFWSFCGAWTALLFFFRVVPLPSHWLLGYLQCIYPVFKDLFCLSVNSNRTAKLVSD